MKKILTALSLPMYTMAMTAQEKPDILWILTDDHRADALECFNMATRGTKESRLGYVSSPALNKLASEGVLFTASYCNSPGSAPSRASMHTGLYPHHRGVYGFEYFHVHPDFNPVTMPEYLSKAGYNTTGFGKLGVRSKIKNKSGKDSNFIMYDTFFNTKDIEANGYFDWTTEKTWKGEDAGGKYIFQFPDGSRYEYYTDRKDSQLRDSDIEAARKFHEKQDILLSYTGKRQKGKGGYPNTILGGENTMPTERTNDGYLNREFYGYLDSMNKNYKSLTGVTVDGPVDDEPQLYYIGYHFPHTPVMPSKTFRDKFKDKVYNIPEFDKEELAKMPKQIVRWYEKTMVDKMKTEEKQQFIRDYYAFCAMGDSLIGAAVDKFKESCRKRNREYVILIVCGDHSWHLGEQGACNKFAAYEQSNHTAVIVVSSDKNRFPAGKVVNDFVEHVDFMPTLMSAAGYNLNDKKFDYLDGYDLAAVASGKAKKRQYVIGEINHVCGPHAMIRTKDFLFTMRTRKDGAIPTMGVDANKDMRWVLDVSLEEADAALYDLRVDPMERNNVAYEKKYRKLAECLRMKLGNIVLGDGRIECNWQKTNEYNRSTFALGADDKVIEIDESIIPEI